MSFVDTLVGAATGYVTSGGNPAGAAVGAFGAMQAGKDAKKSNAQFAQSTEISEKAYQNLDPYRQAGTTALSKYMELLGLENPSAGGAGSGPSAGGAGVEPSWTPQDDVNLKNLEDAQRSGDSNEADKIEALRRKRELANSSAGAPAVPAMAGQPNALAKPQSIYDKLRATPGYNFQVQEEERAINRAAAGRGQFLSGNVLEELSSRAGERAIGTAYQGQLTALSGLAGAGQNAAVGQGSIASGIANQRYNVASEASNSRDVRTGDTINLLDQALQAYNKRPSTGGAVPNNGYTSVIPMPVMS